MEHLLKEKLFVCPHVNREEGVHMSVDAAASDDDDDDDDDAS